MLTSPNQIADLNVTFVKVQFRKLFCSIFNSFHVINCFKESGDFGKIPPELFFKGSVFKNFSKFREKHLYQSLCFNKVTGLWPATVLKKRLKNKLWYRCFPVNSTEFLRTAFLQSTHGGPLLLIQGHYQRSVSELHVL